MDDAYMKELVEHITTSIIFDKTTLESAGLSLTIWEKYLHLSRGKIIRKSGSHLINTGENLKGVYFIKRGKIKSNFLGKDGMCRSIGITGEGCMFGEQFIFHKQPGLFEAVVIEDAELYFFNKDTILNLMQKDFDLNLYIIKNMAIRSRMLASQMEGISLRNTEQNICKILYSLCCYEEKNCMPDEEICIYLSHQDLANFVASHRVTVTKNLNILKNQGVLDYKYQKIIIKDKHKLKEIAFGL